MAGHMKNTERLLIGGILGLIVIAFGVFDLLHGVMNLKRASKSTRIIVRLVGAIVHVILPIIADWAPSANAYIAVQGILFMTTVFFTMWSSSMPSSH